MKSKTKLFRWFLVTSFILTIILTFFVSTSTKPVKAQESSNEKLIDQIIIKLKPGVAAEDMQISGSNSKMSFSQAQSLSVSSGVTLTSKRAMSGDAQVMTLPYPMTQEEVNELIASLNDDPDVEFVEPDIRMYPMATTPDDDYYSQQWHYHAPVAGKMGAANLPDAWDITTGDTDIVIAVLDTGLLPHGDIVDDGDINDGDDRILKGYDFISNNYTANDDDGTRDSDPTDPGDWCDGEDSSWHGTHVTGTIGAISDNNTGVTGVNWNSKILPVRVLGRCGGYTSDIVDAIYWSVGVPVDGVTASDNTADVLNLSLGGESTCSTSMQNAINAAVSANSVVIVAAGNESIDAKNYTPANCNNVITVAAVDIDGGMASYTNYGDTVDIAAPGGGGPSGTDNILSTGDSGLTTAENDNSYWYYQGTSMAAPHIAGIVSLLLSIKPDLTPDQVNKKLQATARTFPTGTESDCTTSLCGAGIVDATALLAELYYPVAWIDTATNLYTGDTIILSSADSFDLDGTIEYYQWQQTAGNPVELTGATSDTASFTAPSEPETLTFRLDVTDDSNNTNTTSLNVSITTQTSSDSGPSSGGGGGGCFIATAAFGTPMQPDVRYLRAFRDEYLLTNTPGRTFVEAYYEYSPPVANKLRRHPMMRSIVRGTLKPLIWLSEAIVSDETLILQTADSP